MEDKNKVIKKNQDTLPYSSSKNSKRLIPPTQSIVIPNYATQRKGKPSNQEKNHSPNRSVCHLEASLRLKLCERRKTLTPSKPGYTGAKKKKGHRAYTGEAKKTYHMSPLHANSVVG